MILEGIRYKLWLSLALQYNYIIMNNIQPPLNKFRDILYCVHLLRLHNNVAIKKKSNPDLSTHEKDWTKP